MRDPMSSADSADRPPDTGWRPDLDEVRSDAPESGDGRRSARILRLTAPVTAAEAVAVFRRKLPGAEAEARAVAHPFWSIAIDVRTRGVFSRQGKSAHGGTVHVLVNATTGSAAIADFSPRTEPLTSSDRHSASAWAHLVGDDAGRTDAERAARNLVRTSVTRTVKLGMRIDLEQAGQAKFVLKPNWVVTGANSTHSATFLVDGLDGSHYIVRVAKR